MDAEAGVGVDDDSSLPSSLLLLLVVVADAQLLVALLGVGDSFGGEAAVVGVVLLLLLFSLEMFGRGTSLVVGRLLFEDAIAFAVVAAAVVVVSKFGFLFFL